jgi:predicted transcriptional regulator
MPTALADATVRLEPDVKDALRAEADAEDRSLSYVIRRIIRRHVRQQQRQRRRVKAPHLRLVTLRSDGRGDEQADNNP